jgi:hypothetical protein
MKHFYLETCYNSSTFEQLLDMPFLTIIQEFHNIHPIIVQKYNNPDSTTDISICTTSPAQQRRCQTPIRLPVMQDSVG